MIVRLDQANRDLDAHTREDSSGQAPIPVFRITGGPPTEQIAASSRAILVFGPGATPEQVRSALDRLAREAPDTACLSLVLAGTDDLAGFQDLIDEDRLFYLAGGALSERDLAGLTASASAALEQRVHVPAQRPAPSTLPLDRLLNADHLRSLALAQGAEEVAEAVRAAVLRAVGADRARCAFYDPERQALWIPGEGTDPEDRESPAVGLTSFILRTGVPLCLPRIGDDPRFDSDLDDPEGNPADRFLGVPVRAGEGEVVAVLTAVRPPGEPAFEPLEIAALEAIAAHVAPYLKAWLPASGAATSGPFRAQALRELESPAALGLEPLRLTPGWTRWTWWLAVATLIAGLLACVLVQVPEYATGVAVVRAGGRIEVTANAAGTVASLAVAPRSRVKQGQLLLTLYSAEEAAGLQRLDRELELKLVQRLQSPGDPVVAQDLLSLRAERELAVARLAERELRAPADGEVSEVRAAPGQYLQAGQPVLAIVSRPTLPSLVALLPGRYLPELRRGMRMRMELPGHPNVYQWVELDSVSAEVIGPAEARRLIGPVAGDAFAVEGPLAVATAPLPSFTFEVQGRTYPYRDGMPTQAEVRVRSERLLFALLPGLKSLWGRQDA